MMQKRGKIKLIFAGLIICCLYSTYYYFGNVKNIPEATGIRILIRNKTLHFEAAKSPLVRIIVWSSYFGEKETDTDAFQKQIYINGLSCLEWCQITGDRQFVDEADALVWHGVTVDMKLNELPSYKNSDQPWVWWNQEAPCYGAEELKSYNNLFNWTMTYRHDSDIVYSYGRTVPLTLNQTYNSTEDREWLSKDLVPSSANHKLAAGVISNCNSTGKREVLIKALVKHGLSVDIYGKCGIPVTESSEVFWGRLAREYKFYLAFENAVSPDYITEKLWRTLKLGILPVVYGGGNYSSMAPPHSYINAREFNSTQQLVDYLKMLDNNATAYAQYFEWRKKFRIEDVNGFCLLCEKIRTERAKGYVPKVYNNLYQWYVYDRIRDHDTNNTMDTPVCGKPEKEKFWMENLQL